jgi:hypothetical protein
VRSLLDHARMWSGRSDVFLRGLEFSLGRMVYYLKELDIFCMCTSCRKYYLLIEQWLPNSLS